MEEMSGDHSEAYGLGETAVSRTTTIKDGCVSAKLIVSRTQHYSHADGSSRNVVCTTRLGQHAQRASQHVGLREVEYDYPTSTVWRIESQEFMTEGMTSSQPKM